MDSLSEDFELDRLLLDERGGGLERRDVLLRACRGAELRVGAADLLFRVGATLRELLGVRLARSGVLRDVLLRACRGAELRVGAADLLFRVGATLRELLGVRLARSGVLRDVLLRACRGAELRVGGATLRDGLRDLVALVGALRVRVVDRLLRFAVISLLEFVDVARSRVPRFIVILRVVGALLVAERRPPLSCVVVRDVRVADRLLVLPRDVSRRLRVPSNWLVSVF